MLVEWPPGSGLFADYDDQELMIMREARKGGMPDNEITFHHELKRAFPEARLIPYTPSDGRSTLRSLFPADTSVT